MTRRSHLCAATLSRTNGIRTDHGFSLRSKRTFTCVFGRHVRAGSWLQSQAAVVCGRAGRIPVSCTEGPEPFGNMKLNLMHSKILHFIGDDRIYSYFGV